MLKANWLVTAGLGAGVAGVATLYGMVAKERLEEFKYSQCTESMPGCAPKSTFKPVERTPVSKETQAKIIEIINTNGGLTLKP